MNHRSLRSAIRSSALGLLIVGCLASASSVVEAQSKPDSKPTTRSKPAMTAAGPIDMNGFVFTPPKEWKALKPASTMRKAELVMPRVKGDSEDGVTVVYYFGAGGAGSAAANLQRWAGQVKRDPSMTPEQHMKRGHKKIHGLEITTVELRGTYTEQTFGRAPQPKPKPNHMMLAAVIETPGGAYYVKTTGPEKTIRHWYKAWHAALDGIKPADKAKKPKAS